MGQAVMNSQIRLIWMQKLAEDGFISGYDLIASAQVSNEHKTSYMDQSKPAFGSEGVPQ
jgi:hypothetical protein